MAPRWLVVLVFVVVGGGLFYFMTSSAEETAREVADNAQANERLADSAPQQQVAATWAVRDAEIERIKLDGVRNGLLAACAAFLLAIAVSLAMIERRSSDVRSILQRDQDDRLFEEGESDALASGSAPEAPGP